MKSGLVSGRLACKSSNSQMLNNIGNVFNFPSFKNHIMCGPSIRRLENYLGNFPNSTTIGSVSIIGTRSALGVKPVRPLSYLDFLKLNAAAAVVCHPVMVVLPSLNSGRRPWGPKST